MSHRTRMPRELLIPALVTLIPAFLLAVSTFLVIALTASAEGVNPRVEDVAKASTEPLVQGGQMFGWSSFEEVAPVAEEAPQPEVSPPGPTSLSAEAAVPEPEPAPQPTSSQAPANFATGDTMWDALAQCEAGGNWSISTGNGYYGGLQFSSATWKGYGGHAYAPNAHLATREQQIEIAEKARAAAGMRNTWPACSSQLGLS